MTILSSFSKITIAVCCIAYFAMYFSGCALGAYEVKVPEGGEEESIVVVGSAALGAPLNDLARHPYIGVKTPGKSWERWEVMCCPSSNGGELDTVRKGNRSPISDYGGGGGDVQIHAIFRGKRASKMIACIEEKAFEYPYKHRYLVWPGPNSNTFVDWMLRKCRIPVNLPAESIGKDYRGIIGLSKSSGGTGFQIETPVVGAKTEVTHGVYKKKARLI